MVPHETTEDQIAYANELAEDRRRLWANHIKLNASGRIDGMTEGETIEALLMAVQAK